MTSGDGPSRKRACGVAVDMGASHLRCVLADADGEILEETRDRVNGEAGPRGVIDQIRTGIASVLRPAANECLRGIAIGVPGGVDPQSGKVLDANNVPGWREVDMGRELEETFHTSVYLDNDANMAAIGESWRGIAKGVDNFVFIALGTGIGAGIFIDGRVRRGHSGFAGELFRMNVDWTRWNDDFTDSGYLEAQVSGVALASEGRKLFTQGNGSPTGSLTDTRDARYLFEALHGGNGLARELVERAFVVLGVGVANMVSVLDPELIVFNGGIVQGAPELLLETVETVVRRIHPKPPRIKLSTLGDRAQIFGGLRTLLEPEEQNAIRPKSTRGRPN